VQASEEIGLEVIMDRTKYIWSWYKTEISNKVICNYM
jgi:hypothetical protein